MGIQWRESLSIGVATIDNQHKELLKRFDSLLNACEEGKGNEELKHLLGFLEDYTRVHFTEEEALQKLHKYPGYEAHRLQHSYFINKIKELREETNKNGFMTHNVIETNSLLLKWLLNHISIVDTELGKFLNSSSA